MRRKDIHKRIEALEALLVARPTGGAKIIEGTKLPEWAKDILQQGLRGLAVISHEEGERLDAAVDALPAGDRSRVIQAMKAGVVVVVSGADARL